MKNRILFFLIILFFNATVYSASPSVASAIINSNGVTDLSDTFGKSHVVIKFTTHEIDIGRPSDERPSKILNSCTYSRYPCSFIDLIEIFVNNIPLFVPRSAYSDLADINGASLRQKQKGEFELSIVGGCFRKLYN